jgi:hypothetical protein
MDPVTAASTIVGLIAGCIDIAGVVYDYARNTAGAAVEKDELLSEIESTNKLLKAIQVKLETKAPQWKNTLDSMHQKDGPLEHYRSALEAAKLKLEPSKTKVGKVVQQAVWHFRKDEFAEILSKIGRSRGDFAALLTVYCPFSLIKRD